MKATNVYTPHYGETQFNTAAQRAVCEYQVLKDQTIVRNGTNHTVLPDGEFLILSGPQAGTVHHGTRLGAQRIAMRGWVPRLRRLLEGTDARVTVVAQNGRVRLVKLYVPSLKDGWGSERIIAFTSIDPAIGVSRAALPSSWEFHTR